MEIPDLSKEEGLNFLDTYLKDKSYMGGYHPTKADISVWDKLKKCPSDKYENVFRWYNHIHSYGSERNSFPNSDIEIKFAQTEPVNTEVMVSPPLFKYPIPLNTT